MEDFIPHFKIRVGLSRPYMFEITPEGLKWSEKFIENVYEVEDIFRAKVIVEINEAVGENWHVKFVDFADEKSYMVDIYTDSIEEAIKIIRIIDERFNNQYPFQYWYQGTLQDHLTQKPGMQRLLLNFR